MCCDNAQGQKNVLFTDGRGPAAAVNLNQYILFSITQMCNGGEAEHTLEQANLALSIHTAAFLALPAFISGTITFQKNCLSSLYRKIYSAK